MMKNATISNFTFCPLNQMAEACSKNNSMWQLIFLPSGGLYWSVAMKAISMLVMMMTEAFMIQIQTGLKKQEDPTMTSHEYLPLSKEEKLSWYIAHMVLPFFKRKPHKNVI